MDGKYDRKPPFLDGQSVGSNGIVIDAYAGRDRWGHRLLLVKWQCDAGCRDCHGKPRLVRSDKLRCGRVKSCGKVKRALRWQYMREKNAQVEAMKLPGMDSITGTAIHEK